VGPLNQCGRYAGGENSERDADPRRGWTTGGDVGAQAAGPKTLKGTRAGPRVALFCALSTPTRLPAAIERGFFLYLQIPPARRLRSARCACRSRRRRLQNPPVARTARIGSSAWPARRSGLAACVCGVRRLCPRCPLDGPARSPGRDCEALPLLPQSRPAAPAESGGRAGDVRSMRSRSRSAAPARSQARDPAAVPDVEGAKGRAFVGVEHLAPSRPWAARQNPAWAALSPSFAAAWPAGTHAGLDTRLRQRERVSRAGNHGSGGRGSFDGCGRS